MAGKKTDWGTLGAIALAFWYFVIRKPADGNNGNNGNNGIQKVAATVAFQSPGDFYQGSTHTVAIQLKNTGNIQAAVSYIRLRLQAYGSGAWSDTGLTPWSPVIPITTQIIQPGQTAQYSGPFTLPTNAELGKYRYELVVHFNGQSLTLSSANAPNQAYAFTVVAAQAALQAIVTSWI